MKKEKFVSYFRNIPVAVNNLYGDPFLPVQKENTLEKLEALKKSGHEGIIGIITKSELTKTDVLAIKNTSPKAIVLVSVSGLPKKGEGACEPVVGDRLKTLALCKENDVPAIAYVRPFIPPYNTDRETIRSVFDGIRESGVHDVVVAGLRGDDAILAKSGVKPSEYECWSYRVKKIPPEIRAIIDEESNGLRVFERTSCGVSAVLGLPYSYNPYYSAPQLCKCASCPLKATCFDKRDFFVPSDDDVELCRELGYDAEKIIVPHGEMCRTIPSKRTECVSCCTSCFKLSRSGIRIKGGNLKLGDTSLLRLLTKRLVYADGIYDTGRQDIAQPEANPNFYLLNSWWSYSREISACYGCSYCIVTHYENEPREYGGIPVMEAEKFWEGKHGRE